MEIGIIEIFHYAIDVRKNAVYNTHPAMLYLPFNLSLNKH